MRKRNGFVTFLTALVPGVGYMYLGLLNKGIQIFMVFLLIDPIFKIMGISFLADIIRVPIWFYTFFDTFNVASKIDRNEVINDWKFMEIWNTPFENRKNMDSKKFIKIIAWALIIIGTISALNSMYKNSKIYEIIITNIGIYLIPSLLVLAGIYLLIKNRR